MKAFRVGRRSRCNPEMLEKVQPNNRYSDTCEGQEAYRAGGHRGCLVLVILRSHHHVIPSVIQDSKVD